MGGADPHEASSSGLPPSYARDEHKNTTKSSRSFAEGPIGNQFDLLDWHPAHQSCQKYFLDHAQFDNGVQAVCALVNISLPHQWHANPVKSSAPSNQSSQSHGPPLHIPAFGQQNGTASSKFIPPTWVSLVPYIRRLVVTGFDPNPVLQGFFGDDWEKGVGPLRECERRNYLFAAKSGGWAKVKAEYDMGPQETVPFLRPPRGMEATEIEQAERQWSQWLAMEDWMVGPRAPDAMEDYSRSEAQAPSSPKPL